MMATQATATNLDKYGDDDIFSTLLRYGLFVGAIFQLLCIGSSILLPTSDAGNSDGEGSEDQKPNNDSAIARRQHKLRKLEKKKRR